MLSGAAAFDRLDPTSIAPIAVAFSGGPDSYEALRLAAQTGRPVVALHVDHGLNSASGAWADTAEALASDLGAGFRRLTWTGEKRATGVPAAARSARHRLMAGAARELGAKVIVTGHTGDDALENAALGQGPLREWAPSPAWPQGRGVFLLRPLLGRRRAEIRESLAHLALVADPANDDPRHPRIAARRAINGSGLPPEPPDDGETTALAAQAMLTRDGAIRLPRAAFEAAPPDARRRVLAAALTCAGGGEGLPRSDRVSRLIETVPTSATLGGAKFIATADTLLIVRDAGEISRGGLVPLRLTAGETGIFDGRYEIAAIGRGVEIRALKGLSKSLPPVERQRLSAIPAPARPGLPVLMAQQNISCPILAETIPPEIRPLVGARFLGACGAIAHEGAI